MYSRKLLWVSWGLALLAGCDERRSAVIDQGSLDGPPADLSSPDGEATDLATIDLSPPDLSRGERGPSCTDSAKNSSETDVDCGGPGLCPRCQLGQHCLVNSDCVSGDCATGLCALAWRTVYTESSTDPNANRMSIWGSGSDVYVLRQGTLWHTPDGGTTWSKQDGPTRIGIWGSGTNDIYVVGPGGLIAHSTNGGTSWTTQDSGTQTGLYSIWGSGSGDVYVVGYGTILHTANGGTTWTPQPIGNPFFSLQGIGGGGGHVYAVGEGVLLHSDNGGATWTPQTLPAPTKSILLDVWATGDEAYAVGEFLTMSSARSGIVLHTTNGGSTWVTAYSHVFSLTGVWGSGPTDIYVVGGTIFHSGDGGSTWLAQDISALSGGPGGFSGIQAIWGSGETDVYAAGFTTGSMKIYHHP